MLLLKPSCECCTAPLPPDSTRAMICSFECTFCVDCVNTRLHNVCPNCGGGFTPRPVRPQAMLDKYPSSNINVHAPCETPDHEHLFNRYGKTPAHLR